MTPRTWFIEVTYARKGKLGVSRTAVQAPTLEEAKARARKKINNESDVRVIAVGTY